MTTESLSPSPPPIAEYANPKQLIGEATLHGASLIIDESNPAIATAVNATNNTFASLRGVIQAGRQRFGLVELNDTRNQTSNKEPIWLITPLKESGEDSVRPAHCHVLNGQDLAIGRDSTSGLIDTGDKYLSRNHAVIKFENGKVEITDNNSTNKTRVLSRENGDYTVDHPEYPLNKWAPKSANLREIIDRRNHRLSGVAGKVGEGALKSAVGIPHGQEEVRDAHLIELLVPITADGKIVENEKKFVNDKTRHEASLKLKEVAGTDSVLAVILDEIGCKPEGDNILSVVDRIRTDKNVRYAVGSYLRKKLDGLIEKDYQSFGERVVNNEQKGANGFLAVRKHDKARDYATLLALAMIDGSWNSDQADNLVVIKDGRPFLGQHRQAAQSVLNAPA